MFRFVVLFACLALCGSHAVLPLVVPAAHTLHTTPLVIPYPLHHGYYGYHGYGGQGLLGQGFVAKPLAHHILKRSPHYVPLLTNPITHVAPVAHVAPLAVSHQSRVDVHTSPAVVAAPYVKPLVSPVFPVAPLLQKSLIAPLHYGAGHYGALYPYYGNSYY